MANINIISNNEVTPTGSAMWCKVNTTFDDYEGKRKYTTKVEFEGKDEATMIAKVDEWYKEIQALPENQGKKWRSEPRIGYAVDEKSGKTQFTFSTVAFQTDKAGVESQKSIPVFSKFGELLSKTAIGNGSKIQVCFDAAWYHKSKDTNGILLFLKQILVKDLVEFGGSSATPAFTFEKFEMPSIDVSDDSIPF